MSGQVPAEHNPGEIRLGSGTALTLIAQGVTMASNVLIGILIARTLGATGKGVLSVVQQIVGIALLIANLGISTSNIYYISRKEIRPGVATGNLLVLCAAITLIAAVPIVGLLSGPVAVLPIIRPHLVLIALAAFSSGLLLSWFGSVVVGLRGLRPQAVASILSALTSLALVVVVLRTVSLSVAGVMLAGVGGTLVGLGTMAWWARGRIGRISVDLQAMRATARHSLRVHLSGLSDYLHLRQDILLLGWLAGASAVGYYSVGVSFAELAWYIPNAVGLAIQAQGARVSHESARDFAARSLRISVLITAAVSLVLAATVPWLLPALFGEPFARSVPIFFLLLPGAAFNGLTAVMLYYQISRGTVYWRISLAVTVLNLVGVLLLVPRWGAHGAAIASSLSYAAYFVWILSRVTRDAEMGVVELLVPTGSDVRILGRTVADFMRLRRA
ncbi:MAG: oligosaccharide flippase family protein [Coriobacteriia bacterium]|jgi:O-antigen/teichoic acid export membrane protein|nr:oligosaccharide flippase family protein [Coriobacteriia bacterium]